MVASLTTLPVIGVPVKSRNSIDGWDSVLSILQMPGGVPVATVALDGALNAGILAAQMIGSFDAEVSKKVSQYKESLKDKVMNSEKKLKKKAGKMSKLQNLTPSINIGNRRNIHTRYTELHL